MCINVNKLQRNLLKKKKYFKRLRRLANWGYQIRDERGEWRLAKWFELIGADGCNVYRTTGTPCSCWMCSCHKYNRAKTQRRLNKLLGE